MTNLLASLVDRTLERAPVLQRRQPTLFEPVKEAMLTRRLDGGYSLREEEMLAESEKPVSQAPTSEVNAVIGKPRSSSRPQKSNGAATLIPQAIDVTTVEEKPKQQPSATNQTAKMDLQPDPTVRDSLVREVTEPKSVGPGTPEYQPSIETIVETKLEREVVFQTTDGKEHLEETNLLAQPPKKSEHSTANDVIARRPHARKKPPQHMDVAALTKRPEQRRTTRQETQRAMSPQLQPEHLQAPTPVMPTINVTIGRVEVRATSPTRRAESARSASPKLSLEDYLKGRSKGN
jgi:hypothetical protein